jgi:hypothetical protein
MNYCPNCGHRLPCATHAGGLRVPPGRHPNGCNCRGCRNDIAQFEAKQFNGTMLAALAVAGIAGLIWLALAPLRIWHVIGSDGKDHPDTATFIAYGVSGGIILLALMFFSIRASGKGQRRAAEAARVREALTIADNPDNE